MLMVTYGLCQKSFWICVKVLKLGAQGHQLQSNVGCNPEVQHKPPDVAQPQKTSFHDVLHAAPEPYSAIPKSHKKEEEAFGPDNDNKNYHPETKIK